MSVSDSENEVEKHIPDEAPPRPENPILDRRAWSKMWLEDNNTLWTVVGDTGDGKSFASLRIGEALDPDFGIENVAFNIVEFIDKVVDDSFSRGSVIVLEEGSVEASSYEWHSESNRVFAKILDTWRHQNRMGVINLPNFQALEKGARRRTKGIVKMQHAAPWRDYSQGKFYDAKYGNIEDRFTTPFPVIDGKERRYIRFSMPSDDLVEAYERKKEDYTADLNEGALESLIADQEEEADDMQPQEIADEIVSEGRVDDYVSDNNGQEYLDRGLIELDYNIGERKGKKVKKAVQREIDREDLA
jgi:hypothetical protein